MESNMLIFNAIAYFLLLFSSSTACSEDKGNFKSEKGSFSLSWCFPIDDPESIQITFTAEGNSFIGLGFGGSMYDADMVIGWVDNNGVAIASDYYSSAEEEPKEDVTLGGTMDIKLISGSKNPTNNHTTLTFVRKLKTGDKYDHDIKVDEPNDMIYAWGDSDSFGPSYHGDNHNHVFIDFSVENGIPDNLFGYEESGALSRDLIKNSYYGTLSTIQEEAAGAQGVFNFPFGSVADFADENPSSGSPLFLLSDLERNVINIQNNPKVTLSVNTLPSTVVEFNHPEYFDEMTKPRTTLFGNLKKIRKGTVEYEEAAKTYLEKHPSSKAWISFSDFNLYRMEVQDVYVVGGFGNNHYIGFISSEQYASVETK